MFQANDSALINPFQSFHSASLPRVSVVKPPPLASCVWADSRIGLELCILFSHRYHPGHQGSIIKWDCRALGAVWEEDARALNPSWFLNHHLEKCNKTSPCWPTRATPRRKRNFNFRFAIGFWLRQELKKCKCPFVRSSSDEKCSRAHNSHLSLTQVSLRPVSGENV